MQREHSYTTTAKAFHWISAGLMIAQLSSGLWMTAAIHQPATRALAWKTYQTHKSLGITLLFITLLRILWRLGHPPPDHSHWLEKWEAISAQYSHLVLYAILIGDPLLGWLMVSSNANQIPTILFGWIDLPHLPYEFMPTSPETLNSISTLGHKIVGWLALALITIHTSATLKHYFIDRNGILQSMLWTSKKPRASR